MLLFWQHGYETTSVSELTQAMGITAPSLYAAFGDKKRLFLEAVNLYARAGPVTAVGLIRQAATARDAAVSLLRTSADAFTARTTPPGCLLASAAASGSPAAEDVRTAVARTRIDIETALREKARRDVAANRLLARTDAAALAAFTVAVIQGMSTLARDGASRRKLRAVAAAALSAWPTIS